MLINALVLKKVSSSSYPSPQDYRNVCSISGKVTQIGKGLKATVQLYSKATNQLLDSTETDNDGNYIFKGLQRARKYFVVSHHSGNQYNAVIQDNVVPK